MQIKHKITTFLKKGDGSNDPMAMECKFLYIKKNTTQNLNKSPTSMRYKSCYMQFDLFSPLLYPEGCVDKKSGKLNMKLQMQLCVYLCTHICLHLYFIFQQFLCWGWTKAKPVPCASVFYLFCTYWLTSELFTARDYRWVDQGNSSSSGCQRVTQKPFNYPLVKV